RPNSWVFKQLASRLGFEDPLFSMTTEEIAQDLLNSDHPHAQGFDFDELRSKRSLRVNIPEDYRPYSEGSHFENKKVRFSPAPRQLTFESQPDEQYPLRLISPPGPFILNTSMGNLEPIIKAAGGEPTVIVHPDDAEAYGISDANRICIESPRGSIIRKTMVSTDAKQGVVIAVGQWWPKLAPDKKSLNDLTEQGLTDLGGGSLFGNAVVRIQPLASVTGEKSVAQEAHSEPVPTQ
ncbi:MAG: molybdopterin dinucleotide binding domain-containing protein, partial [Planctomycetota bacterium]